MFEDFVSEIDYHFFHFVEADGILPKTNVRVTEQNEDSFDAGGNSPFNASFAIDIEINVIINVKVMRCVDGGIRCSKDSCHDAVTFCRGEAC